ncbi:hypothetical protein BH11PSE11_BH11PSE11_01320 [soil metagenome]
MKFVLWGLIVAAIVYWMVRPKRSRDMPGDPKPDTASPLNSEAMLQCAYCGVHVPASEAVGTSTRVAYCSQAHKLLHRGS